MTVATSMIQQREVTNISLSIIHNILFSTEIETTFMPWLMEQTSDALQKKIIARMMVDGM